MLRRLRPRRRSCACHPALPQSATAAGCGRREDGFTLVELLMTMAVSLVVAAAALGLVDAARPAADRELLRGSAIAEGRAGLERMVREIRGADTINATSGTLIDFNGRTTAGPRRIVYACDDSSTVAGLRRCTRYEGAVGAAVSNGQLVIDRLVNATTSQPVFSYLPDRVRPTEVKVSVVLPTRAESPVGYSHRVVLYDSAFLRNVDLTGS